MHGEGGGCISVGVRSVDYGGGWTCRPQYASADSCDGAHET